MAISFLDQGARLVATNPDQTHRGLSGEKEPGCGSLVLPIETAARKKAFFVGKPSPLLLQSGLRRLGVPKDSTVIIGDRMDTDVVAGVSAQMDTVLVYTGVTRH
eukprot:GABV01012369.1.p1 GENE.GABV01012369.1~~GABV01012369.1.p1  ORF type:complete len:104 (-),score=35.87 GABV01012369.1:11-322(-)